MNKTFLALAILGVGTSSFVWARHSAMRLQREATATHQSWVLQTQLLADAQGDRDRLAERLRELKQSLREAEAAGRQNDLWSVLQTNRIGHLAPDQRERLLEELGFNWNSSPAFIVVSKEMLRDIHMRAIQNGKLTDCTVAALAFTPQECSQVEVAMRRVEADFKHWAISNIERSEPKDEVLAQYTVPAYPMTIVTNNFITEVITAIGKERTALIMPYAGVWMDDIGMSKKPMTMILRRFSEGGKQLVKFSYGEGGPGWWQEFSKRNLPVALLPLFPNGWTDVAEREGFEIPTEPEKQ